MFVFAVVVGGAAAAVVAAVAIVSLKVGLRALYGPQIPDQVQCWHTIATDVVLLPLEDAG